MTIKKRIFISNTLMVLLILFMMISIGYVIMEIYNHIYYLDEKRQPKLNENLYEIQDILYDLNNNNSYDWMEISSYLKTYNYQFHVVEANQVLYSDLNNRGLELIRQLEDFSSTDIGQNVYYWDSSTIIKQELFNGSRVINVFAVNTFEDYEWIALERQQFFMIFVIIILCICGVLLINRLFTGNLVKKLMKPLVLLMDGAQRIHDENLDVPIVYTGEMEFEKLCDIFNLMQEHIKEGKEKNAAYEKARTDLVSGISHDLRTPLTSVKGYIKGVKDKVANTPEKQQLYMDIAYKKACDMEVLLQKLFYFSKLETGNMPIYPVNIDLAEFIHNYMKEKKELLKEKDIQLQMKKVVGAYIVSIDIEQFRRVFENIVENSIKYADTEHIEITFELSKQNDDVMILIKDNGVGITDEKLPYIFKQFYRGDESRSSKKDGNGLGLYIVKYIVESHGGRIDASNENGFCIKITLPISDMNFSDTTI